MNSKIYIYVLLTKLRGKEIDYFPSALKDQMEIKPIYKRMEGWLKNTKSIKKVG